MRLIYCLLFLLIFNSANAQRVYYLYLQTDPVQPFFVKMNDQVYPAGAAGFVLLSKMKDSTYAIRIGFPDNKWPEQRFRLAVKGNDQGYLVKDFGAKGWGLFNLQTLEVVMPDETQGLATKMEPREVSNFTEVLSRASNDPTLKMKPVQALVLETVPEKKEAPEPVKEVPVPVAKSEPAKDSIAAVVTLKEVGKKEPVVDAVVTSDTLRVEEELKEQPGMVEKPEPKQEPKPLVKEVEKDVIKEEPGAVVERSAVEAPARKAGRSVVKRKSESSTTEGFGLTFTDQLADGTTDTIKIIIPNPPRGLATIQPVETPEVKPAPASEPRAVTNVCKEKATESDFVKLRRKMAAENGDDDMIAEAKKVFRTKCFTTEQVRLLGGLFLKDAGRYQFFDVAYEHVSDTGNFSALASELKDAYYLSRFNSMLR